jgi:FMN phosphatase YigB (HAD superfamily)
MKITHPKQLPEVVQGKSISVLSVDLFDTLVYRRCSSPDRVFAEQYLAIQELVPSVRGAEAWVQLRKAAELELSDDRFPEEIHLDDIYDIIAGKLSLSTEASRTLAQAELDVEASVIAPFGEFVDVLSELRKMGIKILVNTDIYLPVSFIREIVQRTLPFHADLLCSSDTGRSKRTGAAFSLLKESFSPERLLHVGDNTHSDYRMARRFGFQACVVEWDRSIWLRNNVQWNAYRAQLGCFQLCDRPTSSTSSASDLACDTLAWRWASILYDYLLCLRNYASRVRADEIWFLSRDCESLYSAVKTNDTFFHGFATKYVFTSRASTYPLFAGREPTRFQALTGRTPSSADLAAGRNLESAYQRYLSKGTRRIVIVDAGWKGRVQIAMQMALPSIEVYGFYFSLDHLAEPAARAAAQCFVPWLPAHINQASVECLLGFRGASCTGYSQDAEGNWTPQFCDRHDDIAPSPYCASLRYYLSDLMTRSGPHSAEASLEQRLSAVQQVCMYPDQLTALAFREWSIGAAVDGGDSVNLIRGGASNWFLRLFGIQRDGNLWPAAAVWSISSNPLVARTLQFVIHSRKTLTFFLKRRFAPDGNNHAQALHTSSPSPIPQPR